VTTTSDRWATDYETGDDLGPATEDLAAASDDAVVGSNGVVLAYEHLGEWEYCRDDERSTMERLGREVRAVYVLPE
jgi:hypothetical protein